MADKPKDFKSGAYPQSPQAPDLKRPKRVISPAPGIPSGGTGAQQFAQGAILNTLEDVLITNAQKGDILAFNGSKWVDLKRGSTGQVLTVDPNTPTALKWSAGGGGSTLLGALDDVHIAQPPDGKALTNLDYIVYDAAGGVWKNTTPKMSDLADSTLGALANVSVATAEAGDLLAFSTVWTAQSPQEALADQISLSTLSDATVGTPLVDQVLIVNGGGVFVNTYPEFAASRFAIRSGAALARFDLSAVTGTRTVSVPDEDITLADRIAALRDVSIGVAAKGDLLAWDGTAWVEVAAGTDGQYLRASAAAAAGLEWGAGSAVGALSDLTDVADVTDATEGQVLRRGATEWDNAFLAFGDLASALLTDLTNVTASGAAQYDILTKSAGDWTSGPPEFRGANFAIANNTNATKLVRFAVPDSFAASTTRTLTFLDKDYTIPGALGDLSDLQLSGVARGALLSYDTAVGRWSNLPLGTDGFFLRANAALDGGVEWAAGAAGATQLDELLDVDITTPQAKHVLRHDGTSFKNAQLAMSDLVASQLQSLSNVDTTGVADGWHLVYDGATDNRWEAVSASAAGLGPGGHQHAAADIQSPPWLTTIGDLSIDALNDVDTVSSPPSNNDLLQWNGSQWIPRSLSEANVSAIGHTHPMGQLSDFAITAPTKGDILAYNETAGKWVDVNGGATNEFLIADTAQAAGVRFASRALGDLSNVTAGDPQTGNLVTWTGSTYTPSAPEFDEGDFRVTAAGGKAAAFSLAPLGAGTTTLTVPAAGTLMLQGGSIDLLGDVNASAPAAGDLLIWDGVDSFDAAAPVFGDDKFRVADPADNTKRIRLDGLDAIAPATTVSLNVPTASGSLIAATLGTVGKGHLLVHDGTAWVDLPEGTDTHVLKANAASPAGVEWAAETGGGASALADLTDVAIGTPQAGQLLVYDGVDSWDNKSSLKDSEFTLVDDVDATKSLKLQLSTLGTGVARVLQVEGTGTGTIWTKEQGIKGLNKVNVNELSGDAGRVLHWNGTQWIASAKIGSASPDTWQLAVGDFLDAAFHLHGAGFQRKARFDVMSLSTGVTRVFTLPDADGTLALRSDSVSTFGGISITAQEKGELLVSNGTDFVDFAKGADNQILVADAAQALGVKWSAPAFSDLGSQSFILSDVEDTTKKAQFDVGTNVPTSTTRVYAFPAGGGTLALTSDITVANLPDLGDVDAALAPEAGDILGHDGVNWKSRSLNEAGIASSGHVHALTNAHFTDLNIDTPANKHVLMYDGAVDNKWENKQLEFSDMLNDGRFQDLAQVTISGIDDDDFLQYDTTGDTWRNRSASAARLMFPVNMGTRAKGDILAWNDIATEYQKLAVGTDGQVLKANSAATLGVEWSAAGGAAALGDLSDVNTGTPAAGHVIRYDGVDSWDGGQLGVGDLASVDISAVENGNCLVWNGTVWIAREQLGASTNPVYGFFRDSATTFVDETDITKRFNFQCSSIGTGQTRTLTVQNKDYTIAAHADIPQTIGAVGDSQFSGVAENNIIQRDGAGKWVNRTLNAAGISAVGHTHPWGEVTGAPAFLLDISSQSLNTLQDVSAAAAVKGDVLVYNQTASEWQKLAAGTNNHVLTADSAQTLGVKWAAVAGGSGSFDDDVFELFESADNTKKVKLTVPSAIPTSTTRTYTLPNNAAGGTLALTSDIPATVGNNFTDVQAASGTKGDLLVYNQTATQWQKLGVGTNNQVLTADSAQTAGVKWATGGGGTSLSGLTTDVNISAPAAAHTLVYNGSQSKWINVKRVHHTAEFNNHAVNGFINGQSEIAISDWIDSTVIKNGTMIRAQAFWHCKSAGPNVRPYLESSTGERDFPTGWANLNGGTPVNANTNAYTHFMECIIVAGVGVQDWYWTIRCNAGNPSAFQGTGFFVKTYVMSGSPAPSRNNDIRFELWVDGTSQLDQTDLKYCLVELVNFDHGFGAF